MNHGAHRGYGAMAARLTPDQKVGSSNLSGLMYGLHQKKHGMRARRGNRSHSLQPACQYVVPPATISLVCSAMGRATTQRFKIEAHHDKQFRTKVIATAGREVICRHPQSCVQFVSPLLSCFLEGVLAHVFCGAGWRGVRERPLPPAGKLLRRGLKCSSSCPLRRNAKWRAWVGLGTCEGNVHFRPD